MQKIQLVALAIFSLAAARAACEVQTDGSFIAREACPAYRSFRNESNPGALRMQPGRSYPLVAKNKPDATHVMIEVEGAQPVRRWVEVGCGEIVEAGGGSASRKAEYVLAVSWQPAFCESRAGEAKPECERQSQGRFDASHFTLHGLWPQPGSNIYCNVPRDQVAADKDRQWNRLPAPRLSETVRLDLERVMPGTVSNLDRHEWVKHGTCFVGASADAYFARAIALVEQLNGSEARELFARSIGSELSGRAIRQAFDAAFGSGAGDRVRIACNRDGGRNLIAELTIGLAGEIGAEPSLGSLITASAPTEPGCPAGIVDPVGRQ
jgi:ribonuclease T2